MEENKNLENGSKNKGVVLIILFLLIAIFGVIFGVFEMMQVSEKNNKIAEIEKKQSNSAKDNNAVDNNINKMKTIHQLVY